MLKKFELGFDAIKYVKYSLAKGNIISQNLLSLPIEKGEVTTYLPSTTTELQRNDFEVGGLIVSNEAKENLTNIIIAHLNTSIEGLAVFETLARPSDKWLQASKPQIFTYKQFEVYNFVTSGILDREKINDAIKFARSYPFIGILTSINDIQVGFSSRVSITKEDIDKLIKNTCCILIGAYDDEAILMWKPTKKS